MDLPAKLDESVRRQPSKVPALTRVVEKITSPPFLGMVGVALFVGWGVGFVFYHAAADRLVDANNIVLGRDFMAFYVGGSIVKDGNGERLYEPAFQQVTQDAILGAEKLQGLSYYINPAPVAVVYSLLARLPYLWAFYGHTLFMLGCALLGHRVLRSSLPGKSLHWLIVGFLGACWLPMMHTITGGQNAALCFLLLATAYVATTKGQEWLAGLALGLLLFKPQYALPALGLLLLRRRYLTIATATAVGAAQYVLGGLFCGWDWPVKMADKVSGYYRQAEDATNSATHMSFMEVLDYSVIQPLGRDGTVGGLLHLIGYAVLVLFVLYLIFAWRDADPKREDFGLYWALVTSAALLLSLHTQYYDGALLLLPVLLILAHYHRTAQAVGVRLRLALIVVYFGYLPLAGIPEWFDWFRFQPVFLVPLGVCGWAVVLIRKQRQTRASC